ncbi:hypothetical protein P812_02554 [Serratia marcescens BIDMC 50]|nr:hypothetical protein P812_02554 [Serratia marcescens BIDMC 50]
MRGYRAISWKIYSAHKFVAHTTDNCLAKRLGVIQVDYFILMWILGLAVHVYD